MNKGANIFGVTLIVFWIAILLGGFYPIKDNASNAAILAVAGFILAAVLGLMGEKNKLF